LHIRCSGPEGPEALEALVALVEMGFGEELAEEG
jgi:phosphocarrier protein